MFLEKLHFTKPMRSIALSLLWGGVLPILFFNLATWIDKQYWIAGIHYFCTPLAVPIYGVFVLTYFPGIVFFIGFGWIPMGLNVSILFSLVFNTTIHWLFWQFIWKRNLVDQNDNGGNASQNLKIFGAGILGITFLFFVVIEFALINNNRSLLISNLGLLALGSCLLVYAHIKIGRA